MERRTYIGIEPGDGRGGYLLAALDESQAILALSRGSLASALAYAAGQTQAVVAVSGPLGLGMGRLSCEEVRAALAPPPAAGEWLEGRVAEYLLACRGAPLMLAPQPGKRAPAAARRALELGQELRKLGFGSPEQPGLELIEAQAEAGFWAWLGGLAPFAAGTLEGRIQRQLVLREQKLPVPDAMDFFEEVTRYKLLNGVLPDAHIYAQAELDALAAARLAWLAANQPEQLERVGDAEEGQILLPVKK
jgi:hypothetical protein